MKYFGILLMFAACLGLSGCERKAEKTDANPQATASQPSNETLQSGKWTYRIIITQPGTRSQGRMGELLYNEKPLAKPSAINDYAETPWGKIYWHGISLEDGLNLWDDQGWMRKPRPRHPEGKPVAGPE